MLVSAIHHHDSATGIYMSPPSWTSLPPPCPSHPSRLSQSTRWSSLCHTANPHSLSILHMIIYVFPCSCQFVPPSSSPAVSTSLFSMSASPLLPCKYVHQYHLSRFHMHGLIFFHVQHKPVCESQSIIKLAPSSVWKYYTARGGEKKTKTNNSILGISFGTSLWN